MAVVTYVELYKVVKSVRPLGLNISRIAEYAHTTVMVAVAVAVAVVTKVEAVVW